jgi:hypothetical protein
VSERLLSPVVRGVMRRFSQRAMERLAGRLAAADGTAGTAAAELYPADAHVKPAGG